MTGEPTIPQGITPEEAAELEEYLADRLSPERRADLEQRILASGRLADALYADVSLRTTLEESHGAAPRRAHVIALFRSRWTRIALPLAAGLALLVLSPRLFAPRHAEDDSGFDGTPRFRSGVLEPAPALRILAPVGDVSGEPTFTWTRDPAADAYRVELLGTSGEVVFATTTTDTSLDVARASLRDPLAVSAWRVVPRRGGVDEAPSSTSPLRLLPR